MRKNAKHTAGPWHARGDGFARTWLDGSKHFNPAISTTQENKAPMLAEVFDRGLPQECAANARLIAAAPELLAALIALHDAAEMQWDFRQAGTPEYKAVQTARAAIAKAKSG